MSAIELPLLDSACNKHIQQTLKIKLRLDSKVSGSVLVYDDEFMHLLSTQGLSECDLSFVNELILLLDGYWQFSTDFQTTRIDINSILYLVFMRGTSSQCDCDCDFVCFYEPCVRFL